jgi:hypothetical protein
VAIGRIDPNMLQSGGAWVFFQPTQVEAALRWFESGQQSVSSVFATRAASSPSRFSGRSQNATPSPDPADMIEVCFCCYLEFRTRLNPFYMSVTECNKLKGGELKLSEPDTCESFTRVAALSTHASPKH